MISNLPRSVSCFGLMLCDAILVVIAWLNIASMREAADIPSEYRQEIQGQPNNSANVSPAPAISRIDGNKADSPDLLRYYLCSYRSGDSVTVTDVRSNTVSERRIRLVSRYTSFEVWTIIIVGLSFIVFGIYVIVRQWSKPYAGILHALTMSTSLMILYDWGTLKLYSVQFNALRWILYDAMIWILPSLFFHFTFLYPNEKKQHKKFFITFFYVVSLSGFVVSTYYLVQAFFFGYHIDGTHYLDLHAQGSDVFLIAGLLCAVANLEHSALTIQNAYNRKRIYWVLLGITFGPLVYVFLILVPRTMLGYELISISAMLYSLLMAPLMFYLAVRKTSNEKMEPSV